LTPITRALPPSQLNVAAVRFAPGARTAWHSHDGGQTLYVTEGRGLVQARGQQITELTPGDFISPKAKKCALTRSRRGAKAGTHKSAVTTPADESSSVCQKPAAGLAAAAGAGCVSRMNHMRPDSPHRGSASANGEMPSPKCGPRGIPLISGSTPGRLHRDAGGLRARRHMHSSCAESDHCAAECLLASSLCLSAAMLSGISLRASRRTTSGTRILPIP
jgi:Cupin domain